MRIKIYTYVLSELFYSTRLVSGLTVAIRNLFTKRYTNGCIFYLNSFLVFFLFVLYTSNILKAQPGVTTDCKVFPKVLR